MALDVKKHVTIAAGEQPSRAGLAAMILSINDVIPVASVTARTQLISDLTTAGITPSTTRPLVVLRADAPGLQRLEYTTDGAAWITVRGELRFANKVDADAWATTNAALLTTGDRALINGIEYQWQGAWRLARYIATAKANGVNLPTSALFTVVSLDLPADAPAGTYRVTASSTTGGSATAVHYQFVSWAGAEISDWLNDYANAVGGTDHSMTRDYLKVGHAGGAATVLLQLRVNSASAAARLGQLTVEYVRP